MSRRFCFEGPKGTVEIIDVHLGNEIVSALISAIKSGDRTKWNKYALNIQFDAKFSEDRDDASIEMARLTITDGSKSWTAEPKEQEPDAKTHPEFLKELKKI